MIVDIRIRYAVDFIPARGRLIRRGRATEIIPLEIRDVSTSDAPVVLSSGSGWFKSDFRSLNGLIFGMTLPGKHPTYSMASDLNRVVEDWQIRKGLAPDHRRGRLEASVDADIVRTRRDLVLIELTNWANRNLIVLEDRLHQHMTSPLVSSSDLVAAYGETLGSKLRDAGIEFVPAWFPPKLDGQPMIDIMRAIEEEQDAGSVRTKEIAKQSAIFSIRIVDPDLHAGAAKKPENLSWGMLGKKGYAEFRSANNSTMRDAMHPGSDHWMHILLDAMARSAAAEGRSAADIVRAIGEVISRPPGFRPKTATMSAYKDFLQSYEDLDKVLAKLGCADLATTIDHDSWNLRVVATRFVTDIRHRLALLPLKDLDAFARLAIHLKNWRAYPAAAFSPEAEERFVMDAATIVRLFDDPAFEDVGQEWERSFLRQTLETMRERFEGRSIIAEDDELSAFRF